MTHNTENKKYSPMDEILDLLLYKNIDKLTELIKDGRRSEIIKALLVTDNVERKAFEDYCTKNAMGSTKTIYYDIIFSSEYCDLVAYKQAREWIGTKKNNTNT